MTDQLLMVILSTELFTNQCPVTIATINVTDWSVSVSSLLPITDHVTNKPLAVLVYSIIICGPNQALP